jgi:large subunit ribosomal protein L6
MSRIGKLPISVPEGIKVAVEKNLIRVEGPQGQLEQKFEPNYVEIAQEDGTLTVNRKGQSKNHRARHGLYRSLIANMVQGVQTPFEKKLQLVGLGYKANLQGLELKLDIGFSHQITYKIPEGMYAEANEIRAGGIEAEVILRSPDKQLVGEIAAEIRDLRKPEPYNGTGIRYHDEQIIRKEGKLAGAAGGD